MKILVIDELEEVSIDLVERLNEAGHEVQLRKSMAELLPRLGPDSYDLLLLNLADFSSLEEELLERLVALTSESPGVIMQLVADEDQKEHIFTGIALVADETLVRPVEAKLLLEKIHGAQEDLESRKRAIQDPLTGLFNRYYFNLIFTRESLMRERYQSPMSLLFIDLDQLSSINLEFGQEGGDKVLVGIAQLIKANVRQADILCRWEGQRFAMLLPNTDQQEAMVIAERIRMRVQLHHFPEVQHVSVSIGIAHQGEGRKLFGEAREALDQAKLQGRNRVVSL